MRGADLLDRPDVTARRLRDLGDTREIAVDTEGANFHRFVDRVYLLQVSTRAHCLIVDPLTVPAASLEPLAALLERRDVESVFHDADYDLRLLRRDYGWRVRAIFDTRVAAQLLGIRAFGLAALLEQFFGVRLDKKHQRADWSLRPLPDDMLEYAAQDTRHLLDLRDRLRDELDRKGRLVWVREECEKLEDAEWPADDPATAYLRVKGARDLSRRELAVLRELVAWRDAVAREVDRATFRVLGNEPLLAIARAQPATLRSLAALRGVSKGILERRAAGLLDAVRCGLAVPEAELPKFPKAPRWDRDPRFDTRVAALKTARDALAPKLDLDPGVLCARERLEAVARKNPRTREELLAVPELRRWQADVLGASFLKALGA